MTGGSEDAELVKLVFAEVSLIFIYLTMYIYGQSCQSSEVSHPRRCI